MDKVLLNLLSYLVKMDEAPCSAEHHMGSALRTLCAAVDLETLNLDEEMLKELRYYTSLGCIDNSSY